MDPPQWYCIELRFDHFQFAEKLGIENQMDSTTNINQEKYYMFIPLHKTGVTKSIEVSLENKGLLFETPNILQIQYRNVYKKLPI